jgi:chemotaxis protein MotB
MRRRKKHGAPNHERWVVSYADFMTLLFAFFVVLFASSQADTKKQKALAQAMQAAFSQSAPEVGGAGVVAKAAEIGMRPDSVVLRTTPEGLVISLREYGFFASGSSVVREPAVPILVELARALPEGLVRVEGHTDTVPIHTAQFPSNWELSSARAAAIARILLEYGRVAPGDVAVEGLAEFHPVEGNDTEAERAENRRVDVIVLRRTMLPKSPGF